MNQEVNEGKIKASVDDRILVEEFMGFTRSYLSEWVRWNDVMPVVEKIRDYNTVVSIRFNRQLNTVTTQINSFLPKWNRDISISEEGIKSVWLAVIEFIKWYNQN